jgi:hypothetical protein
MGVLRDAARRRLWHLDGLTYDTFNSCCSRFGVSRFCERWFRRSGHSVRISDSVMWSCCSDMWHGKRLRSLKIHYRQQAPGQEQSTLVSRPAATELSSQAVEHVQPVYIPLVEWYIHPLGRARLLFFRH